MIWVTIFLLAVSLAMDAMAVSVTLGICKGHAGIGDALKTGIYFGSFQALMPAVGYIAGSKLASLIAPVDHWIAFALLAFIGIKMIYEALHESEFSEDESCPVEDPMSHKRLLVLGIATSVDALAAGISIALDGLPVLQSVITIGVVTMILSALAVVLGRRLGVVFQKRATVIGGVVLNIIGLKILFEHLGLI
jgi:putative Mn2+ efflux pump MntP